MTERTQIAMIFAPVITEAVVLFFAFFVLWTRMRDYPLTAYFFCSFIGVYLMVHHWMPVPEEDEE
jgi:hypothetical protein